MEKPIIFISHIHEEKELAIELKKFIDESFLDMADVFVSSDMDSIELGCKWLDKITNSLRNCVIELLICSSNSITKPWINFEAGAGWIRNTCKVIPICHSGLMPKLLPIPLNMLQGMVISEEKKLHELFEIISKEIECKLPSVDYKSFILTISKLEKIYTYGGKIKLNLTLFLDFLRKYCFIELKEGLGTITFENKIFLDSIKKNVIFPKFCVKSECIDSKMYDCFDFLEKQKILKIDFCGSLYGPDGYSQYFYIK